MFEQLTLEKLEGAVYAVLPSGVEKEGRDLCRDVSAHLGRVVQQGTFYVKMRYLLEAGSVEARDDKDADGDVRYYSITGGRKFRETESAPINSGLLDLAGLSLKPGT